MLVRSFLDILDVMYSGGKQSSRENSRRLGQRRFFGGTFVAHVKFSCLVRRRHYCLCWREAVFPRSCSQLSPSPYAQAVSKKLQPRSTERWSDTSDSLSSEPVQPAIPQHAVANLADVPSGALLESAVMHCGVPPSFGAHIIRGKRKWMPDRNSKAEWNRSGELPAERSVTHRRALDQPHRGTAPVESR